MKQVVYASIIAMGCTIAVAAQGGMAADQSKDKMGAKDAGKSVTLTGCVAESAGHFMLTNATMGDQAGAAMSYGLTGENLKPHVGHKVTVTGMMSPKMGMEGSSKGSMGTDSAMGKDKMGKDHSAKDSTSKDTMAHGGMKGDMKMSGAVVVKSLKMVSATCS
jgi:hypothetical protein